MEHMDELKVSLISLRNLAFGITKQLALPISKHKT